MESIENDVAFCPLCKNKYDNEVFIPRMLPECGHSFCSACLKKLLNESEEGFVCPEDKILYRNRKSILSFPKNFALLQIINKQNTSNNLKRNQESSNLLQSPLNKRNPNQKQSNYERIKEELFMINNYGNAEINSKNTSRTDKFDKICPIHKKKMELFCLEEKERICTNCALFGNHKNHEIEEEDEILKRINTKAEKLLEIIEKLECFDEININSFLSLGQIYEECVLKRTIMNNLIQEKFAEINKIIKKLQETVTFQFNDYFNKLQTTLACLNKIPVKEIIEGLETWKNSIKNKLLILSQKTENDEVCFEILEENKNEMDSIIFGQKLIKRLEKLNEIPINLFSETIKDSKLTFNEILIKSLENNFYQMNLPDILDKIHIDFVFNELIESTEEFQSKKELLSISEMCQEKKPSISMDLVKNSNPFSLESLPKSPIRLQRKEIINITSGYLSMNQNDLSYDSVKTVKRNMSTHDVKIEGISIKIPENNPSNEKIPLHFKKRPSKDFKTNEDLYRPASLSHAKKPNEINNFEDIGTPQRKVVKKTIFEKNITSKQNLILKLKIPEKYKVIFDELKKDKIEQVDLSNAELGDKAITHLADLIAESKNIKTLKLRKNKISDEGFAVLIEAFRKNESLKIMNFEFNLLSEVSIDSFCRMIFSKKNGLSIKKVSFLNNNINTTKCKIYAKEAKAKEVDLYI